VIESQEPRDRTVLREATLLVFLASLLGRTLGFARDLIVAYFFGAGSAADSFFLANRLPAVVAGFLVAGLTAGMVPVFTQRLVAGRRDEAWSLTVSALNVTGVSLAVIAGLCMVFAPWLVPVIAPGFDAPTMEVAVHLFRILMPTIVFAGLLGLATGVLNSLRRFGLPAFATSVGALATVVILFATAESWGLSGLALAVTAGAAVSFLVLIPQLVRCGLPYRLTIDRSDPGLRQLGGMIWPILLGSGVGSLSIFIDQVLGSLLGPGSISSLSYSEKLLHLPQGLIVMAVLVPLFPLLSEDVARGESGVLKERLSMSLSLLAFGLIPASLGLMILRTPIIALLFQHGEFTPEDTVRTAPVLLFYAVGLFPYAGRDVLTRVFYSFHDTHTPVKVSIASVVLNVVASVILMQFLGVGGLALGTSIAFAFNFVVLLHLLRRKTGPLGTRALVRSVGKIIAAAAVMGAVVWGADRVLAGALPSTKVGLAIEVGVAAVLGVFVYAVVARMARLSEMSAFAQLLRSTFAKMRRSPRA
jgi:putative peptidoglycan lipid II flippase